MCYYTSITYNDIIMNSNKAIRNTCERITLQAACADSLFRCTVCHSAIIGKKFIRNGNYYHEYCFFGKPACEHTSIYNGACNNCGADFL